jgi:hypothetical protein
MNVKIEAERKEVLMSTQATEDLLRLCETQARVLLAAGQFVDLDDIRSLVAGACPTMTQGEVGVLYQGVVGKLHAEKAYRFDENWHRFELVQ